MLAILISCERRTLLRCRIQQTAEQKSAELLLTHLLSGTLHVSCTPFQGWTGIFVDLSFHFSKYGVLIEADKIILVIKAVGEGRVDAEM